jgi:hypothetical protein
MKKRILSIAISCLLINGLLMAQTVKSSQVPATAVKALIQKYPTAAKITWEKEHGNYEANWGGKSGEDMSVTFNPAGVFVEQVEAIAASSLPPGVASYVKAKYKGAKITEAGKVTDAKGTVRYEAEVKGRDLIFDGKGNFLKVD